MLWKRFRKSLYFNKISKKNWRKRTLNSITAHQDWKWGRKMIMSWNRLRSKFSSYRSKLARKQDTSCHRVYDHDLPWISILYRGVWRRKTYPAEYKRHHHMDRWGTCGLLELCIPVISETVQITDERIFVSASSCAATTVARNLVVKKIFVVEEGDWSSG